MTEHGPGGGCGFLAYHVRHQYRTATDEPRTCSGLYPPPGVDVEPGRCTSMSEDGRRCHGDIDHPGTHWAGASRVWSDIETLVRP